MAASTATAAKPRKSMMRSPVTGVIILGVTLAGGAYILWRRNQANAASNASTTSGTDTTAATDDSGALATLQSEIADLQSSAAQGTAAGGGSTGGTTSGGTSGGSTGGSTGGTSTGGTSGGGTTSPPKVPPVITVVNPGIAAADISWTGVPGATGYNLDITGPQGSHQASPKVSTTHARVDLPAGKKNLKVKVQAYNAAGAGPWSATRTFSVGGKAPAVKKAA